MAVTKFNYSNLYNTAVNLIYKFGAIFTHRIPDTTFTKSYSPDIGGDVWTDGVDTYTEQPYIDDTAEGVIVDFTEDERRDSSIKVGDKKLLTVEIIAPKASDIFVIGTTSYSYINHETIQPASTTEPLLYKIQLRV